MKKFLKSLTSVIKRNPAEIFVSLLMFVLFSLLFEKIIVKDLANTALAPIFIIICFVLNRVITNAKYRFIYYLSALFPLIIIWVDATKWIQSSAYIVSLIIALLSVISYNRLSDNHGFVNNLTRYFKEIFFTMFMVLLSHGLILAIFFSFIYLFDIFKSIQPEFLFYTSISLYLLLAPALYLYVHDNITIKEDHNGIKLLESLFNYVITPALIIYSVVLYLYISRIIIGWSLPKGQLAYMVFTFTMVAFFSKACHILLKKSPFELFYKYLSFVTIPPIIVFWVGVLFRISEYGFTEGRVYLVVCGFIMTITSFMFMTQKLGRYIHICYATMLLFALSTYIPPVSAKNIAIDSQRSRLEYYAQRLSLLDMNGKIIPPKSQILDTVKIREYKRMCESYEYLAREVGEDYMMKKFGFKNQMDIDSVIGNKIAVKALTKIVVKNENERFEIAGFKNFYATKCYKNINDSLVIRNVDSTILFKESLTTILATQMRKIGYYVEPEMVMQGMKYALPEPSDVAKIQEGKDPASFFEQNKAAFLIYDKDSVRLIFRRLDLSVYSDSKIKIDRLIIVSILTR